MGDALMLPSAAAAGRRGAGRAAQKEREVTAKHKKNTAAGCGGRGEGVDQPCMRPERTV